MEFYSEFDKYPPANFYWGMKDWVSNVIIHIARASVDIYDELNKKYGNSQHNVSPHIIDIGDCISVNPELVTWFIGQCERYGYDPSRIMFRKMWNVHIDSEQPDNTLRVFKSFSESDCFIMSPEYKQAMIHPPVVERWIKINDNG